jgi:hypothetical protein
MGLAAVLGLAFLAESLTEYFFADFLTGPRARYLKYMSCLVGIGLALVYRVDALGPLFGLSPRWALPGQALTGVLLGRGANFIHDIYSRYGRLL